MKLVVFVLAAAAVLSARDKSTLARDLDAIANPKRPAINAACPTISSFGIPLSGRQAFAMNRSANARILLHVLAGVGLYPADYLDQSDNIAQTIAHRREHGNEARLLRDGNPAARF